jgi:hypothetical protein
MWWRRNAASKNRARSADDGLRLPNELRSGAAVIGGRPPWCLHLLRLTDGRHVVVAPVTSGHVDAEYHFVVSADIATAYGGDQRRRTVLHTVLWRRLQALAAGYGRVDPASLAADIERLASIEESMLDDELADPELRHLYGQLSDQA